MNYLFEHIYVFHPAFSSHPFNLIMSFCQMALDPERFIGCELSQTVKEFIRTCGYEAWGDDWLD